MSKYLARMCEPCGSLHMALFLDVCFLGLKWILWVVYVRNPFLTDESFILVWWPLRAWWQGEVFGRWRILTMHFFSIFGTAWRWEGRSMRKSPYSSVLPFVQSDLLVFFPVLHETIIDAPDISIYVS